jgi:tetratricopeptide (TPR) repeat protein
MHINHQSKAVPLAILILGSQLARAEEIGDCAQRLHLERAIAACTLLIEQGDREGCAKLDELYKSRADAYFASGDYERAIADLSKAITLNPKGAEGYVRRGIAYEKEGDHKDAIADFSAVIRLKPGYATAYTMRGGAYEVAGDKGKAIADFRAALAIDPSLDTVKSAIRRLAASS